MNNKFRRPRVTRWERDGEYIAVTYTQEDGQRVAANFKREVWTRPPREVREEVTSALAKGPIALHGNRGGGHKRD
jgi:hypothetical protein